MNFATPGSINRSRSRRSHRSARVEALETRTLLSAWSTINTYSYPGGSPSSAETSAYTMAEDSAGNLYAAGQAWDSTNTMHGIVLERTAGSPPTSWTTVEDLPNARFDKVVVDSAGDVIVSGQLEPAYAGNWLFAVKPAGQSSFTIVNSTINGDGSPGINFDGSGNAFLDGTINETVNGVNQQHWVVEEEPVSQLVSGQAAFTKVDDFFYKSETNAHSFTYIPSGAAAGLYVAGDAFDGTNDYWIVRKSTDDGKTWSTVDNFVPSGSFTNTSNIAYGVSGDLSGNNVYVVGNSLETVRVKGKTTTTSHWIVLESIDGGATWTVVDDFTGATGSFIAHKIQPDQLGNMYVVGEAYSGSTENAVVRANTGPNGSWVTVDNYSGGSGTTALYYGSFVDSSNDHYALGTVTNTSTNSASWLIRTDASTTASPAAVAAVFSSTQVNATTDPTDLLYHRKHRQ